MKTSLAALALFFGLATFSRATELIIDRIVIEVAPIKGIYFASAAVEVGKASAKYHVPAKPYHGNGVEIPVNLRLKDVEKNHWCKFTLHLDKSDADVVSYKALEKCVGRFQIADSGTQVFIPYQNSNHSWIWKLVYHTKS